MIIVLFIFDGLGTRCGLEQNDMKNKVNMGMLTELNNLHLLPQQSTNVISS